MSVTLTRAIHVLAAIAFAVGASYAADQPYPVRPVRMIVSNATGSSPEITGRIVATKLTAHLAHEEADGLPLIDASLTEQEWQHFAQVHAERIRGDAPLYMPWLLNGASPQMLDAILGKFPPPLLAAFREEWGPRYAGLDVWNAALPDRA